MSVGRRAGSVLAGVLLTACTACSAGSGEEPRALEPVTTASPTATATPVPSASPGEAGVVAQVVRDYYAAVTQAYASGDTAAARALVDPVCPCLEQLTGIESLYAGGKRVQGSAYALGDVRVAFVQPELAGVDVTVDVSAGVLRDRSGSVVERTPVKEDQPFLVTLSRKEESWRVASVDSRS